MCFESGAVPCPQTVMDTTADVPPPQRTPRSDWVLACGRSPDLRVTALLAFPELKSAPVACAASLTAHSCGGSRGFSGQSQSTAFPFHRTGQARSDRKHLAVHHRTRVGQGTMAPHPPLQGRHPGTAAHRCHATIECFCRDCILDRNGRQIESEIPSHLQMQDSPDANEENAMVWLTKTLMTTCGHGSCCWREALLNGMCHECSCDMGIEYLSDVLGRET